MIRRKFDPVDPDQGHGNRMVVFSPAGKNAMARLAIFSLCMLLAAGGEAQARDPLASIGQPPKRAAPQEPTPRYPMNYTDELAQRLGIEHGHMDVFSMTPGGEGGVMPTVKGGIDRNGAGVKLQWKIPK